MNNSYRNDVAKDFKKSTNIEVFLKCIYFLIFSISVLNIFYEKDFIIYTLIIFNIIYISMSLLDDMIIKNKADSELRKTLLENAFSSDLTSKKMDGYYNNNIVPSMKKLGVDSFESVLYTKNTLSKMLIHEGIKTFLIFIIWLIIITKFHNKNLLLTITQTFFSFEILISYIKIIYYYAKVSNLYDSFYQLFVTNKYNEKNNRALLLEYVIEYECLKSYCHIILSNSIFNKYQADLSKEWDNIHKNIN